MENNFVFKSEAVFDPLGNCLMRVYIKKGKDVIEKTVPLDVYIHIITGSILRTAEESIKIGRIPEHFYNGTLSAEEKDTFSAILFYPAEKRYLSFAEKHWFVPFPPLVFKFKVYKGTLTEKACYALDVNEICDDALLYAYPFGNVSAKSGSICMGNVSKEKVSCIKDFEKVVTNFFESKTNNDHYSSGDTTSTSYRQEELLKKLEKMDFFPTDWLTQSGAGCSVGELLND